MSDSLKNLKIGILMGGISSEREISLKTGEAIYKELKKHGFNVVKIDINTRDIKPILEAKPDVVVIGLHGTYGEDGVMQGILEFLGIPYTGSPPLASAIAMNKIKTKEILKNYKINTPEWEVIESEKDINKIKIKYPLIFKPESEGSAVGVYIVKNKKNSFSIFRKIKKISKRILVEKYIKGIEISVPILLNKALPIIEIIPKNEFYDYDAKYTPGKSIHIIPARLNKNIYKKAQNIAEKVHSIIGCRDFSRIDMIVKGKDIYVLEVNTLPGMTSLSLYPESAKKAGISFYKLLKLFIVQALRRKK